MKGTNYSGFMGPGIGHGLDIISNGIQHRQDLGMQIRMAQQNAQNRFNAQSALQDKANQSRMAIADKNLQAKQDLLKSQQSFTSQENKKKMDNLDTQKGLDRANKTNTATMRANVKKDNFNKSYNQKLTSNAETLYNNMVTKNPYVKDYAAIAPIVSRFNDSYSMMIKDPTNTKLQTAFLDNYIRILNGNKALRQFMVQNTQDIQTSPEKVKGWFQKNIQSGGLGFSLDTLNRIHQYVDTAQGHIAKKAQEQIQNAQQVAEKAGFGQQFGLLTKGLTGSSVNANTPPTTSIPFSPGQMYNGHKILSVQAVP